MNKIYIFSNVNYPEEKKISTDSTDILVFINHAQTAAYYEHEPALLKFNLKSRRECNRKGGNIIPWCITINKNDLPKAFIKKINEEYNTDCFFTYKNKKFPMTTGYIAVSFFHEQFPDKEIILVNFGYKIKHSTKRPFHHNWIYEEEKLKSFTHIYNVETISNQKRVCIKIGKRHSYIKITKNLIIDLVKLGYKVNVYGKHSNRLKDLVDKTITKKNCDFFFREKHRGNKITREGKVYALAEKAIGIKIPHKK